MSRASHLRLKYGITEDQYEDLLLSQGGCCYVCERPREHFRINLAVDHNHVTGEIRGLLCSHCNHRLIGRHTDPDLLERMSKYLRKTTGLFVPIKKKRNSRRKK